MNVLRCLSRGHWPRVHRSPHAVICLRCLPCLTCGSPGRACVGVCVTDEAAASTGCIPHLDAGAVANTLDAAGDNGDFPFQVHAPAATAPHVLVTIEPTGVWESMSGGTVRVAIAWYLARHADVLRAAGYGVATWEYRGAIAVLIVATTPEAAEAQAPEVRAFLSSLRPEPPAPKEEPWMA